MYLPLLLLYFFEVIITSVSFYAAINTNNVFLHFFQRNFSSTKILIFNVLLSLVSLRHFIRNCKNDLPGS